MLRRYRGWEWESEVFRISSPRLKILWKTAAEEKKKALPESHSIDCPFSLKCKRRNYWNEQVVPSVRHAQPVSCSQEPATDGHDSWEEAWRGNVPFHPHLPVPGVPVCVCVSFLLLHPACLLSWSPLTFYCSFTCTFHHLHGESYCLPLNADNNNNNNNNNS